MRGIDLCDQMVSYYSCPRKTVRYKKVMLHYLDVTLNNSYYLYKLKNTNTNMEFLDFRESVIRSLLNIVDREKDFLANELFLRPRQSMSLNVQHYLEIIPKPSGWKRNKYHLKCTYCTKKYKKVSYTSYRCKQCSKKPPLCPVPCFELYHKNSM